MFLIRFVRRPRRKGESSKVAIGLVAPPTVNRIPIYTSDPGFKGERNKATGAAVYILDALDDLHTEWQEKGSPGSFPNWLMETKGWDLAPVPLEVVEYGIAEA
jgi:hypothetical protein